jgi:hypothetical protein
MIKNYKIFSDIWSLSNPSTLGSYIRAQSKAKQSVTRVSRLLDKKLTSKRRRKWAKWGKVVYQWEMKCIKLTDQCTCLKPLK